LGGRPSPPPPPQLFNRFSPREARAETAIFIEPE
jgi:hypothetical protein